MDILAVSDELAAQARTIAGLRVYQDDPGSLDPPALLIPHPDEIAFDATYGRGADRITWSISLVVGKVDFDKGRLTRRFAPFVAGSGTKSIKQVLQSGTYASLHSLRVTRAEFAIIQVGTIDYQGVVFELDIFGQGSA